MRTRIYLIAFAGLVSVGPVSGNEAESLISRVVAATSTLTYDGVFVYARDGQVDAMRVVHTRIDGKESERLIALSGPPSEALRDGTRVTCTFPDDKAVMVGKYSPRDYVGLNLTKPVEQVGRYYDFALGAGDRIAGRDTQVLTIAPRTRDRYSIRLWIDNATDLLLKSAVIGANGDVLEQVMFSQVTIGEPLAPDALQAELNGVGYTWQANSQSVSPQESPRVVEFSIGWLPVGFEMKEEHTQRIASREPPVKHHVYSDGLAVVSVFVEKLAEDAVPMQGYTAMGAVHAFSRVEQQHQITVVGEVPQSTVRQIAASVAVHEPNQEP